jgi:hypothetical protein
MWGYQPHDQPGSSHPNSTTATSVSKASRHLVAKQVKHGWETWPLNFAGSFTCRKSATCDRRLYFPSEGRRAADFITLKIHRPRPGLNPRTLGPMLSTLTTRPPRATVTLHHWTIFPSRFDWSELQHVIVTKCRSLYCLYACLRISLASTALKCFHEDGKKSQCHYMRLVLRLRIRRSLSTSPLLRHETDITVGKGLHLPIHFSQNTFKNNISHHTKDDIVGKRFRLP